MLRFKKGEDANKPTGVRGKDMTVKPCPHCGGHPIAVDILVKTAIADKAMKGKRRTNVTERRTYYHCQCNACITDWCKPVYKRDKDGIVWVVRTSHESAHDAWVRKEWLGKKKHRV